VVLRGSKRHIGTRADQQFAVGPAGPEIRAD